MGSFDDIKNYLAKNGELDNVDFIFVETGFIGRALNAANERGLMIYTFYFAYRYWHLKAYIAAKKLMSLHHIDLIHYLNPIGYREPGFLWKIDKPYIWGPISGFADTKTYSSPLLRRSDIVKIKLKNFVNSLQCKFSLGVRKALNRANIIVAATAEGKEFIQARFGIEAIHIPENAIPDPQISEGDCTSTLSRKAGPLRLICVGSIDVRKSVDFLFTSIYKLPRQSWHLDIVGSGPQTGALMALADNLGISDRIKFHGRLDRDGVIGLFDAADLHVITSRAEGNPTTLWEAMARGVPTLTLDHCGMSDSVCNHCGTRTK